jgi:hypothetical protein
MPYEMLSIPIIKRLTANIKVKRKTPNNGDAKTINDTANDKILTPNRNILDHFEIRLAVIPWMILAIPRNKRPKATKPTSIPVAINGNAITTTPNAITNAPRPILLIRDDLGMCNDSPIATLSIPTTSKVIESRKIKVAISNAGFNILQAIRL